MAVGTTMLALGAISAGTKAVGAWNSSRAAKKAGKQQAEGAERAGRAVESSYRTQMGLMDPYAALGRQSANTLGRLMQPGVPYTPDMQARDVAEFQGAPSPWGGGAGPMRPGMAVPRGGTMAELYEPPPAFMPFARPQPRPIAPPSRIPPRRRGGTLGALMPGRRAA